MILKRTELYDAISKLCKGEYAIGLHGVDYTRLDELVGIDHEKALDNIFNEGLKIFHGRSINGTVKFFGRIDKEEDQEKVQEGLNEYLYGQGDYIVVAIPTILRTKTGEELFLGSPNLDTVYKGYLDTLGNEKSTLLEECIVKHPFENNVIEPQYILGKFKKLDSDFIDFYANKNHIAFNGGFVSQEEFDFLKTKVRSKVGGIFKIAGIEEKTDIFENVSSINEEKIEKLISLLEERKAFTICETLRQLKKEKRMTKVFRDESFYDFKYEEENKFMNNKIIVELKRGFYYGKEDEYYVEFNYPTEESKKGKLYSTINGYIKYFGMRSDWAPKNHDCVFPYLIDKEGNITPDEDKADAIGGTNIPDALLKDVLKEFIEYDNCWIICGDLSMMDTFDEEVYNSMIGSLEKQKKL